MTSAGVGQAAMEETAGVWSQSPEASCYGDLTGLAVHAVSMGGIEWVEGAVKTADDRANTWPGRWFIA